MSQKQDSPKTRSGISSRLISLKIFGSELLTFSSKNWFTMVRLAIFIMALTEALSWGYFGSLLVSGYLRFVLACILFLIVFVVVWSTDVSLVTLDRGMTYYDSKIYQTETKKEKKVFSKINIAVVTRVLMLTASVCLIAPFINQLVFNKEIKQQIAKTTNQIIEHKREGLKKHYDSLMKANVDSLSVQEKILERELSGNGLSKKYGPGPVAKAIEVRVNDLKTVGGELKRRKDSVLTEFNNTASRSNYALLEQKFGLALPQNSLTERARVIAPILNSPEAEKFELAIRGLLAFLFLALILLKIFEPRGIKIYLSEALQQAYQSYKRGAFIITG